MSIRKRIVRGAAKTSRGSIVRLFTKDDLPVSEMLQAARPPASPFRRGEYLHVSDLVGKCIRKIALAEHSGHAMPAESISHSMGLTFAQGTAIHDYIKDAFIRAHRSKLYGRWACRCGATCTEHATLYRAVKGDTCETCGGPLDLYEEAILRSASLGVRGAPDVVLHLEGGALHIVEIKSKAHEQWKELVRPDPDHVIQVLLYWYIARELGWNLSAQVSILYATKGFMFSGSPFREFVLDAEASLPLLADYIEDAQALVAFKNTGALPRRVRCANIKCSDAKKCHVAMECFECE